MPEIVAIRTNVPERVALKFADGKPVDGKFGARVMFSLADGRTLYTPPIVQDKIRQLGIGRGEPFEICKQEEGGKVLWTVARLNDPAAPADPEPAPPAPAKTRPELLNELGQVLVNGTPAKPAPVSNGIGRVPDAPYSHTGWAAFLREQAMSLIDVAASCHRYAAEKYPGMLRNEDVSDLVTTAFINLAKNGGAR